MTPVAESQLYLLYLYTYTFTCFTFIINRRQELLSDIYIQSIIDTKTETIGIIIVIRHILPL